MKPIKELSDFDLDTIKKRGLSRDENLPEPTKRNMRKMVDKVNQLTEVVNTMAERLHLIKSDKIEDTWG